MVTPSKTKTAELELRYLLHGHDPFPRDIPVKVTCTFYRQRPKSLKKSITMPVSKPDVDNYFKLLCDTMNGFIFGDDAQVTTVFMRKRFGMPERIELRVEEDGDK